MAFCSNCGNRIEEGTRFCTSCGTPVNTGSIDVEPAAQERAPQETVLPERPGNEAKKKKKNNNALIAVLVFLAAIVIGIMVLGKSLTDELKNASGEPIPKELEAFYIGEDKCGIVIRENGTADFYADVSEAKVLRDQKCGYKNNTITVQLPEYGYCIYADCSDGFDKLIFKSKNKLWNEEAYYRAGEAKEISAKEFSELYKTIDLAKLREGKVDIFAEEKKSSPEPSSPAEDPNDGVKESRIRLYGMEFWLPENFRGGEINDRGYLYETDDGCYISVEQNYDLSSTQFLDNLEKLKKASVTSGDTSISLYKADSDFPRVVVEENKNGLTTIGILLLNKYTDTMVAALCTGDESVVKKYKNDMHNMAKNVKLIDNGSTGSDSGDGEDGDSTDKATSGGVDPDLKAYLDEYESFMDSYVDFMHNYKNSSNAMGMLADYSKMLEKLSEFQKKAEKYDQSTMSSADYNYYVDVMTRINAKLLKAAY